VDEQDHPDLPGGHRDPRFVLRQPDDHAVALFNGAAPGGAVRPATACDRSLNGCLRGRSSADRSIGLASLVWLLGVIVTSAQTPAARPQMAEEAFKNVQVLKGIPVDEFMATMGFFSASLGMNCTDCHGDESGGDWAKYADDNDRKRTSRRMIQMVTALNRSSFGGRQMVTCNTCHRGNRRPNVM